MTPAVSPNLGPLINQVSIAHYVVAVFFVALRFYTRGFIVRKFGLDDFLITVAVLLGAAQTATIVLQVRHGRGQHAKDIEMRHFNHMLMFNWINVLVYFLANWAVKMSMLALYHRIGSAQKGLPWVLRSRVIWSIAIAITTFTVAVFLFEFFGCTPIYRAWDVRHIRSHCLSKTEFNMAQAAINVFVDLLLLVYPLPLLQVLKINIKQRSIPLFLRGPRPLTCIAAALVVIFSIGIVPVIASIMRLCEIIMAATPRGASWLESDTSWNWAWIPAWSQIEVDVGIVAASLPSLSPLLKQVWSGFAMERPMTPSQIPTLLGLESKGFRSESSLSVAEDTKDTGCLTFFDESEEELDRGAFLDSVSEAGVVRTVDTKAPIERLEFGRWDPSV